MAQDATPRRLWLKAGSVWLALNVALAATLIGAFLDLGAWQLPVALGISAVQAGLVAAIFMELVSAGASSRIAVLTGVLWLALMFALTFADEATRQHMPPGFDTDARQ